MHVRDAVESDVEALSAATGRPETVVTNLIHDRSVRVAVADADAEPSICGFLAFDVRDDTVHITEFDGDEPVLDRLLDAPTQFARREEMAIEAVVVATDQTGAVLERVGFHEAGSGPRFDGQPTTRYVMEPDEQR